MRKKPYDFKFTIKDKGFTLPYHQYLMIVEKANSKVWRNFAILECNLELPLDQSPQYFFFKLFMDN